MQYLHLNENKQRGTFDFPFEFYHIDRHHPQYVMSYHWHVEYEILRVLSGSFTVTLDEKTVPVKAGEAIFINSGILHSGIPEDCVYQCIVFDLNVFLKHGSICAPYIQQILDGRASVYHHFDLDSHTIRPLINDIFDAFSAATPGYELAVFGCFFRFFGAVFQKGYYYETPPQSSRDYKKILQLKQVLEYIEDNYHQPITLEQLSESAGMTPKYFCRFFMDMTHRTPMDYVNSQRIDHAAFLLSTGGGNVTEVAYSCGFNDLSYFIKTFKKYKKITPGKYTRQ